MVVPAMQLASKIPDMSVQLWSSALLKGTSRLFHQLLLFFFLQNIICVLNVFIEGMAVIYATEAGRTANVFFSVPFHVQI